MTATMKNNNYCIRQSKTGNTFEILIYSDIEKYGDFNWETWKYEQGEASAKTIMDKLAEIPEDMDVTVYINSNGGDVYEAASIFSQLRRHKGHVTGIVDGCAHSAAFTILQAADERIMNLGTSALIHNMWTFVAGNASQLRKAADDLDATMESMVDVLMERATISRDEMCQLLDKETILTPATALQYGLIDRISGNLANQDDVIRQLNDENDRLRSQLRDLSFRQKAADDVKPKEKEQGTESAGINAFFQA